MQCDLIDVNTKSLVDDLRHLVEMKARIAALGAENNIRLLGSVDHALVKAMMICANALLNPSLFEGWSTTVEEAKAVGTPMLLSDLHVHREQAPGACFFEVDDPLALATAIDGAPSRSLNQIRATCEQARETNLSQRRHYAATMSEVVRETAKISGRRVTA